ncbi:hypothetical protein BOTNAR_0199g00160 [Botryotinia narcissicola]|uniref:Uncharacterized protein n=1 Tax=Botryotinia narcissicola TaxID=278944 RepID=A0A4Z1I870_9HELO|nr:hypothetical protein BOTNAR_0199g00160 [Botryotinia narcissicola]
MTDHIVPRACNTGTHTGCNARRKKRENSGSILEKSIGDITKDSKVARDDGFSQYVEKLKRDTKGNEQFDYWTNDRKLNVGNPRIGSDLPVIRLSHTSMQPK